MIKRKKITCKKGHDLSLKNALKKQGYYYACRACRNDQQNKYMAKRRLESK